MPNSHLDFGNRHRMINKNTIANTRKVMEILHSVAINRITYLAM